ncbi:MAG: alpha-mannosidase [Clostridia bacterium]|nr:alpha-mannosidase [Clostridia bacterium]
MKCMSAEWQDRLMNWMRTLEQDLYEPLESIPMEGFLTGEELSLQEAEKGDFSPMRPGDRWGKSYEYLWLRGKVTLPEAARGQQIVMDLKTGGETTVFVNGRSFGTYRAGWVEIPHHYLVDNYLTESGQPGTVYELMLESYAGHDFPQSPQGGCGIGPVLPGQYEEPEAADGRATLGNISFGIWNEEAYQLYLDLETLREVGDQVPPESLRAARIAETLQEALLIIDFEQGREDRIRSYRAAREALRPALAARNGTVAPEFYAIGNAHLDLAWLWPTEETNRKTSRTFAAQLRLIERYPEYKYLQSQPAAYAICRKYYPELYERIRQAIRGGQWIAEGAMWVEPDTNITSGESLARQLIHGKRFYREELGVDSVMLWLPDSFGYSAALPQLLKASGVRYLVTQKIFWSYNDSDRFPYHYFTWKGADGSCIDTFLPTSYTYRTQPEEICETWKKRVQKDHLDAFLLPFGYGDGGGGPARDHIEFALREKDLQGMPRMRMEGPVQFFEDMERKGGPAHTWQGELYFSAHRGVYTSQAAIKRGNRKSELALREAEMWGAVASWLKPDYEYPREKMDEAWKLLLFNQFHDILPGSSIGRVYERARAEHRRIIGEADAVREGAVKALTRGEGLTVFNSLSFARDCLVTLPDAFRNGAALEDGTAVPVDGNRALVRVPACGAVTVRPAREKKQPLPPAKACMTEEGAVLENAFVSVRVNRRGEIVSLVRRETGREFVRGAMNRLLAYKDIPRKYDAWDVDSNYIDQPVPLNEPVTLTVLKAGGLEAVLRVERRIMHSDFSQEIILRADKERLDFVTRVDWHELHRLLKVSFAGDVQADEGINEIQFGYLKRPAHRSRQYDRDRFEVCNQRYSALADEGHGFAVLNDCKYGISMLDQELQLTLLRAPASPEMRADNGRHEFTYSLLPWDGPFLDSPVVDEAYDLNVPPAVAEGACDPIHAFSLDVKNVYIDTVKPAEDGSGDLILRLYEAKRADTACRLALHLPCRAAWVTDLMENRQEELAIADGALSLHFHPFEVRTVRISR